MLLASSGAACELGRLYGGVTQATTVLFLGGRGYLQIVCVCVEMSGAGSAASSLHGGV